MPAVAAGAAIIGGTLLQQDAQRKAANSAKDAQVEASNAQIAEQQRQFDAIQKLLGPYVQGGQNAFGQQGNLIGLGGTQAQQGAIDQLLAGPEFQSLNKQGQEAILANAAATGGLRGGNTQNALADFRSNLLSQLIGNQFNRLGAISQQGLGAATQTGAFGQAASNNITGSLGNIGQAQAGAALARGSASGQLGGLASQLGAMYFGGGFSGMGGNSGNKF